MEKMEKYTSYQNSGIDWLQNIPSHWEVKTVKALLQERKEMNYPVKTKNILSLCMYRGVIPYSEKGNSGNRAKDDITAYKLAYPNDIVLNSMNVIAGSVGLSKYFGVVSPVYYMLRKRNENDSIEFLNYVFRTETFQKSLIGLGNGILVKKSESTGKLNTIRLRISMNKLNSVNLPYPPQDEQIKIAEYLDNKTSQLDGAISQKEKLIDLLKEQKQITINDAVTKGLDKNVELQNANLKNFGYIPKHWKIMFNRRLFREENRKKFNKTELPLSLSQVDGVIPSGEMKERSLSPSHRDNFKLCLPNDLVVNRFKGHLGVFFKSDFRGIVTFHYGVFKPSKFVNTKYYEYLFHTQYYKNIYAGASNGMTIGLQNLSNQNFYDVKSIVPPIDEQNKIVGFIEQEEIRINKVIQLQLDVIAKLKEYKASLTDSVVTGKVRVS